MRWECGRDSSQWINCDPSVVIIMLFKALLFATFGPRRSLLWRQHCRLFGFELERRSRGLYCGRRLLSDDCTFMAVYSVILRIRAHGKVTEMVADTTGRIVFIHNNHVGLEASVHET